MPDGLDPKLLFNAAMALAMVALQVSVVAAAVGFAGLRHRLPAVVASAAMTGVVTATIALLGPALVFSVAGLVTLFALIGLVWWMARPSQGDPARSAVFHPRWLVVAWVVFLVGTIGLAFLTAAFSPAASGPS
jgi:hypothetical protein